MELTIVVKIAHTCVKLENSQAPNIHTYMYIHTYILFVFKIEIHYFNMPAGSYANLGR